MQLDILTAAVDLVVMTSVVPHVHDFAPKNMNRISMLGASTHLYKRDCLSLGPFVGPSVGPPFC